MNKTMLLAVVGILIAGSAVFGFLVLSKKSSSPQNTNTGTNNNTTSDSALKSLKDLFTSGVSQECTFSDTAGNGGTVYIGGGKMKGNFKTTGAQGTTTSNILVDGKTSYIWVDGQKEGIKMSFDVNTQLEEASEAAKSVDLDQKVNYNCKSWVVASTSFAVPSDVSFSDLGNLIMPSSSPQTGSSTNPDTKATQCAYCDSLSAEAKAQCRIALSCN